MHSKNVLYLGLLYMTLLTVFCIAKYLNQFHPNIKTVPAPTQEVIDKNSELLPVQVTDITKEAQEEEVVDKNYLKVIQLVEQEERDIKDAYESALRQEAEKNLQTTKVEKPIKTKIVHKKRSLKKRKGNSKNYKRCSIETILANQTLVAFGKLSYFEKQKLKKIVHNFKMNPSSYLRIETDKKSNKFYNTKRYLARLGIPQENIQILHKRKKNTISISTSDYGEIEISVIKKD